MISNIFPKIVVFMNNVVNYSTAALVTDDHITRRMRFACWITKATITHTQNMSYLLVLHGENCHMKAPECCIYTHTAYRVHNLHKNWIHRVSTDIRQVMKLK